MTTLQCISRLVVKLPLKLHLERSPISSIIKVIALERDGQLNQETEKECRDLVVDSAEISPAIAACRPNHAQDLRHLHHFITITIS